MERAGEVHGTGATIAAQPKKTKADLRMGMSLSNFVHACIGVFGGALVLRFMWLEREMLLVLPGLLLLAYGLHNLGSVIVRDGVLQHRALRRSVDLHVDEIREIGLGQMKLPPTKYWLPVVDTFDGESFVLYTSMSLSKERASERVRTLRKALGVEPDRLVDRFAGTRFKPKRASEQVEAPTMSGYEEYLLMKEALGSTETPEPRAVPEPPAVEISAPPRPVPAHNDVVPEQLSATSWSDDTSPDQIAEVAPEVFTPQPLRPQRGAIRSEPEPQPHNVAAFPTETSNAAEVQAAATPAPQLTSLFSTPEPVAAAAPKSAPAPTPATKSEPPKLKSLFGSSAPAEAEPVRLVTLFGTVKQERKPITSLFGSAPAEPDSMTEWSEAA